jgi:hypothetical protein
MARRACIHLQLPLLLLFMVVNGFAAEEKPTILRDLPPSPMDTNAMLARVPKPNRVLQSLEIQVAERGLEINVVGASEAQKRLRGEIAALKRKLETVETAAYDKDPLLEIFGRYEGQAHEWVIKNHNKEISAADLHYRSGSEAELNKRTGSLEKLSDLIHMAIMRELSTNADFEPLLKAGFEALPARLRGSSYARQDSLLRYRPEKPAAAGANFDTYLAEIGDRYEVVMATIEQIQTEDSVPPDVVAGLMYRTLYQILDGGAETYVLAHTPPELSKLREQLRRKYTEMLNTEKGL